MPMTAMLRLLSACNVLVCMLMAAMLALLPACNVPVCMLMAAILRLLSACNVLVYMPVTAMLGFLPACNVPVYMLMAAIFRLLLTCNALVCMLVTAVLGLPPTCKSPYTKPPKARTFPSARLLGVLFFLALYCRQCIPALPGQHFVSRLRHSHHDLPLRRRLVILRIDRPAILLIAVDR
jgi:hypothetical protein